MNEALNEFATAFGSEHSPTKSKKGCVSRGGGRGECGRSCNCTYDVIDLQNTTHSLGGQLNGAGRHKQWLKNVLFQNISDSALK